MTNSREPASGRGSNRQRLARKLWLLATFGDGVTAACAHCGVALTLPTLTVDRVTPGHLGGRYERGNIRPSCLPCASRQGGLLSQALRRARTASNQAPASGNVTARREEETVNQNLPPKCPICGCRNCVGH